MESGTYDTKDLYFAAYLHLKLEMVGVRREEEWNPKKGARKRVTYFVFKDDSAVSNLKSQYFSGRGEVSALAYADSVRNLKTLLYI